MDPYAIAVAEIMLQQTQVERVLPRYAAWLQRWPDWHSLAQASSRDLLTAWSGLGYNRRAMYLGRLAREVVAGFSGTLPDDPEVLMTLPGIGRYTAHAILVFSANRPLAAIDTNVRRVLVHELGLPADISLRELEPIALRLIPRGCSRDWHNALMDYSRMHLPRTPAKRSSTMRKPPYHGSIRQIRGEIIRRLTNNHRLSLARIAETLHRPPEAVRRAALALEKDGLVRVSKFYVMLSREKKDKDPR